MPARRESKTQSYSAALPNRRSKCAQPTRRGNTLPVIAGGSILPRATLSRNRPDGWCHEIGQAARRRKGRERSQGMVMHAVSRDSRYRLDFAVRIRVCEINRATFETARSARADWVEWKIFRSRAIARRSLFVDKSSGGRANWHQSWDC